VEIKYHLQVNLNVNTSPVDTSIASKVVPELEVVVNSKKPAPPPL
jgi:hypothetical protein